MHRFVIIECDVPNATLVRYIAASQGTEDLDRFDNAMIGPPRMIALFSHRCFDGNRIINEHRVNETKAIIPIRHRVRIDRTSSHTDGNTTRAYVSNASHSSHSSGCVIEPIANPRQRLSQRCYTALKDRHARC